MRTIKAIHKPVYDPIADLITYRVIPTPSIDYLDPFLFLNHHGPQVYPPNNDGLPFGPHPHRGMETVTFILDGDIAHYDSNGHKSVIEAGGVQWMTAGRGLIHAEVSSEKFKRDGGPLEILQLWVNLPAKDKMCQPFYKGLQQANIPRIVSEKGLMTVNLISGEFKGIQGAFKSRFGLYLATIDMKEQAEFSLQIPAEENIFFYIIRGTMSVNEREINNKSLVEFENEPGAIKLSAKENSILLVGHAKPLNEPVVSQGPFVMNTREEIVQAYADYRQGEFGKWEH